MLALALLAFTVWLGTAGGLGARECSKCSNENTIEPLFTDLQTDQPGLHKVDSFQTAQTTVMGLHGDLLLYQNPFNKGKKP